MPNRSSAVAISRDNEMLKHGFCYCHSCRDYLPLSEFYNRKPISYYCKNCEKTKRDAYKAKAWAKSRNYSLKSYWVSVMGGKCQRCGYSEFVTSLEFHHVSRSEKSSSPSPVIFSNDKLKTASELDKCCLLCRNCHMGYESNSWTGEFIKQPFGYSLLSHRLINPPREKYVYLQQALI